MPGKRAQVLCDCGNEVVKIVLSHGRIRMLAYGRGGLLSWFIGKQVFREDRRSAAHQIAARLETKFGLSALDDTFDPIMRAFATAVVSCDGADRLISLLEALSREVTGDESFLLRGETKDVLVRAQMIQSNMSFY